MVNVISAIAARSLSTSTSTSTSIHNLTDQPIEPDDDPEEHQSIDTIDSSSSSSSSSSSHPIQLDPPQLSKPSSTGPKKLKPSATPTRYFSTSTTTHPDLTQDSSCTHPNHPDPNPHPSHPSHPSPPKTFKRPRPSNRSIGLDPDCRSTWTPIWEGPDRNLIKLDDHWFIGLNTAQTLIPHGSLQLIVLHGTVEIMGSDLTSLSSQPTHIFAPSSHPLPIITSKPSPVHHHHSSPPLDLPLDPSRFSAIIRLGDLDCGIQLLDQVWSSNANKPPIWSAASSLHPIRSRTWSLILSPSPDLARLILPLSWSDNLSNLSADPQIVAPSPKYWIEGPKGVGKSTFSTLLINSLLNTFKNVALLDLDPGQPLLTPPTLLSLHILNSPILGPSFCRLVSPHQTSSHSIYLGHTTPKDCSNRYVESSLELFNLYTNRHSELTTSNSSHPRRRRQRPPKESDSDPNDSRHTDRIPLVINTMGWTKGLGQELLDQLSQTIQPTCILSFSERTPKSDPDWSRPLRIKLEPIPTTPLSLRLTPADGRILTILSYLYANPRYDSPQFFIDRWEFDRPLWIRRPFEVRPDRFELPDHPGFNRDHIGFVLNGGLIGFIDYSQRWWIGFGLVRSINPTRRSIQLLTPAYPTHHSSNEIEFVKYSEPELPLICYSNQGVVPYLERQAIGANNSSSTIGSEKKRVRRNLQRRSQVFIQ